MSVFRPRRDPGASNCSNARKKVVISARVGAQTRVRWWREGSLLADSFEQKLLSPERVTLYSNGSLRVLHVQREDSGEYVCQAIRPSPWGHVTQVHKIEVMCEYATMYILRDKRPLLPSPAPLCSIPRGNPSLVHRGGSTRRKDSRESLERLRILETETSIRLPSGVSYLSGTLPTV